MAEIESLGNSYLYASMQSAAARAKKNQEAEKTSSTKKTSFSSILKKQKESELAAQGLLFPPEIEDMSVEDAAVFLRDAVEIAGNELRTNLTQENLQNFKEKIKQFLTYVEKNNYEVTTSTIMNRRTRMPVKRSPVSIYSPYQIPAQTISSTKFSIINQKLDDLTRDMMILQKDNLILVSEIDEIKGLIINLLD